MERFQIENIYKANGIGDYQLKTLGDLYKIHGINARIVEGYTELSEIDKKAFETYIIKHMNLMGMMSRIKYNPVRVFRAYNVEYLVEQEDNSYYVIGGETWDCSNKENPTIISSWRDEEEEINGRTVIKKTSKDYLRINYTHNDIEEWLHIIKEGNEWY